MSTDTARTAATYFIATLILVGGFVLHLSGAG
jgi:TRAP-type mannitol/chloroaromatic compound transport system permease small subunit